MPERVTSDITRNFLKFADMDFAEKCAYCNAVATGLTFLRETEE